MVPSNDASSGPEDVVSPDHIYSTTGRCGLASFNGVFHFARNDALMTLPGALIVEICPAAFQNSAAFL